jgi:hypothetical protein
MTLSTTESREGFCGTTTVVIAKPIIDSMSRAFREQ